MIILVYKHILYINLHHLSGFLSVSTFFNWRVMDAHLAKLSISLQVLPDILVNLFPLARLVLGGGRQRQRLQSTLNSCCLCFLVFRLSLCTTSGFSSFCLLSAFSIPFSDHSFLLLPQLLFLSLFFHNLFCIIVVDLNIFKERQAS